MSETTTSTPTASSASSTTGTTTTTAYDGKPGILFVGAHIQQPSTPEQLLHDWYKEHYNDLLTAPGSSNLCLRLSNTLNPSAYANPHLELRNIKPASAVRQEISSFAWKYLALNKVNDLAWLNSPAFLELPLTSPLLPKRADGSDGGAFDVWIAGLRVYETADQRVKWPAGGGRKWTVTVQVDDLDEDVVGVLERVYGSQEKCRTIARFRIANGLSQFPEPGPLPEGLVVFEFEGDEKPVVVTTEELGGKEGGPTKVVRTDLWEVFVEAGDKTLEL